MNATYTTEELFKLITDPPLWYVGYCDENYANLIKMRHRNKALTLGKYQDLFNHFGFKIEWKLIEQ